MILTTCVNPSVDSFWSVDKIRKNTTNRSRNEEFYPGGKGIHTAFALREFDQDVAILGVWGGQTGHWLHQKCLDKKLTVLGPIVEEWNRICITIKSDSSWNETELLGKGPTIDNKTRNNFRSIYKQFISTKDISAVIISGSILQGFSNDLYGWLVTEAKKYRIPAFVDASGPLLEQTLTTHPFAVHINHHEGRELCGKNDPFEIGKWLNEYCELAAVTAGADGLYLKMEDELLHASYKIKKSDIFSTIGSGDCLLAGLCLAYLKYDKHEDWARFAVACGSANCIYPRLGMLKKEDVNAILSDITVTKIGPEGLPNHQGPD